MSRNLFRSTCLALAVLSAAGAALVAPAAPSLHQVVRVKNATTTPIKISYLAVDGKQKWEDLAPNTYTDADITRGAANNILLQLVGTGAANQANTQLSTPPPNPGSMQIRVNNATAAKATVSFYSLSGQKWVGIDPNTFSDVEIAKGPAGHLLLQVVPNQ